MALGSWALAIAGAAVWSRGAAPEFDAAIPSRYIDFIVLLSITNAWCGWALLSNLPPKYRGRVLLGFLLWVSFVLVGWLGLSAEMMKGLILPRVRDRDAPIRYAVQFQRTGDPEVFHGQPSLYIPHPSLEVIQSVLINPELKGHLPPSFQPNEPLGMFSAAARWAVSHSLFIISLLCCVPFALTYFIRGYLKVLQSPHVPLEHKA